MHPFDCVVSAGITFVVVGCLLVISALVGTHGANAAPLIVAFASLLLGTLFTCILECLELPDGVDEDNVDMRLFDETWNVVGIIFFGGIAVQSMRQLNGTVSPLMIATIASIISLYNVCVLISRLKEHKEKK